MPDDKIWTASELPQQFPIFPLPGCILFPGGLLPLNIFEPRYLNMIDDARASGNVIGMIQSLGTGPKTHPDIATVGGLGELIRFTETSDGRYLIVLRGITRFAIGTELPFTKPYREVEPDYTPFPNDLAEPGISVLPGLDRLKTSFRKYLSRNQLEADWENAEETPPALFVNAVAAACPFDMSQKQELLETEDLLARCQMLTTLLEHESNKPEGPSAAS